jgi:hypothetical protein
MDAPHDAGFASLQNTAAIPAHSGEQATQQINLMWWVSMFSARAEWAAKSNLLTCSAT